MSTKSGSAAEITGGPALQAVFARLKAFEPSRTAGDERSARDWPHLGAARPHGEAELLELAEAELARRRAYLATPEGRYLRAISMIEREVAPELQLRLEDARQAQSRGFATNAARCARLAEAIDTLLHRAALLADEAASAACEQEDLNAAQAPGAG